MTGRLVVLSNPSDKARNLMSKLDDYKGGE